MKAQELKDLLTSVMPDQINRWGVIASMESWENKINLLCDFNEIRSPYALMHTIEHLKSDSCFGFTDSNISEQEIKVLVFPNPTNSNINLQFLSYSAYLPQSLNKYSVTISNLMNNILFYEYNLLHIIGQNGIIAFDLDLDPGIYFITVSSNESKITKKFIYLE